MARALGLMLLSSAWVLAWFRLLSAQGIFRTIGWDFAVFRAQSLTLRVSGPENLYSIAALRRQIEPLAAYTATPDIPLPIGPSPYPPLFAWLLTPFALPPAPFGFTLWTALGAVAAVHLAWRAASFFQPSQRPWIAAIVLTSFPVMYSLFCGQPMLLLASAMAESFISLRAGKEIRAGFWASLLLFKPQYFVLIGPLLLWKRRWRALAGAAAGALGLVGGSLAVAGLPALLAYPRAMGDIAGFATNAYSAFPTYMINWRSLILALAPYIDDRAGIAAVIGLGALTVLMTVIVWRGPWAPQDAAFSGQVVVLLLAELLVNYHSHLPGLALLIVPIAALTADHRASAIGEGAVRVLAFAPTLVFVLPVVVFLLAIMRPLAWLVIAEMVVLFASLLHASVWPPEHTRPAVHAVLIPAYRP